MYVQHNFVKRSRDHDLHVTVSCIKVSSVAQQCFYVDLNNEIYVGLHVKCPMLRCDEKIVRLVVFLLQTSKFG